MKGELKGYKIDIPDPPVVDGWEAVEFRPPMLNEWYFSIGNKMVEKDRDGFVAIPRWIMRRKPRRRIVFEECGERGGESRSFYLDASGSICFLWYWMKEAPISFVCWLRRTDEEVGE